MRGTRSLTVFVALGIIVCPVAAWSASGDPLIAGLCGRIDPSDRLEGLEYFPLLESRVQREYREPVGLEAVREALPGFLSDLEQRDPVVRIEAVARFGKARSWIPPGNGAAELDQWLIDRLRSESQSQVVEAIIRVLGEHTDTPGLAPILIELIRCDRDPELRSTALEVASSVSDPAMLGPLIRVWSIDNLKVWNIHDARDDRASVLRALARLKDRRTLSIAMEGLEAGYMEAAALMRAVGTQTDVPGVIAIYKKYPSRLPMVRGGVLYLIADLGGLEALAFLRTEFERLDGDERIRLAGLALRAQLEPGRPEWTEVDQRNCVPMEEVLKSRLPYVQKDVDRLLREENEPFFRALVFQTYQDIGGSLREWSRHLDPPHRVEHWRRVVGMLGGDPSKKWSPATEPTVALAKALASRASQEAPTQPGAALRDIKEAIALSNKAGNSDPSVDRIRDVRTRVERLIAKPTRTHAQGTAVRLFSGTYRRSTGLSGHALALNADGTYKLETWYDAMGGCTNGRSSAFGSFHIEKGYLALEPGPSMKGYGIDAPDLLLPVLVEDRLDLVEESQLADFCRMERTGKLSKDTLSFYVGSTPKGAVERISTARAVCAAREY